jgi:UDP-N-acetylglucosamine 2-epimerase (non-hydrolysing)
VISLFSINPDHDLDLMQTAQTPTQVASAVLSSLDRLFHDEKPDWVLVQGDTTTAMAASLAAFYAGVVVGHVEAGLRTNDKWSPFPEEGNRRVVGVLADWHFSPTMHARNNLIAENVSPSRIIITGNTGIDALYAACRLPEYGKHDCALRVPRGKRIVLVTMHRREHFGKPIEEVCRAIQCLAEDFHHNTQIVYPVHPNPNVSQPVHRLLDGLPGVMLLPPLSYLELIRLLERSYFVMTDSGGLQEEAPYFGKPVLVLRDSTERPEGVLAGVARVIGVNKERVMEEAISLLTDPQRYQLMSQRVECYGDGKSAERIVQCVIDHGTDRKMLLPSANGLVNPETMCAT